MFIRLFILLLIQTFPGGNDHPFYSASFNVSSRQIVIEGKDTEGPYKLPDIFILKNSLIVIKDSIPLENEKDYYLDTRNGTIILFESLETGEKINISYNYFPFNIKKEYKRRDFTSFVQGRPVLKGNNIREKVFTDHEKTGIIIGGAKTFSIGMSSSTGFSFNQTLKVNITGEIIEGLSINGVLSDENTPLEPEGVTESLEEFDRIFVRVEGRGIGATLGDYQLNYRTITTPIIQRDLLGITGEIKANGKELNVSFGLPRGNFHSLHIKGIEGKQGPYQLKGPGGEEDIIIVTGTETVYLDGLLVKRGETNDYLMNNSLAQITFTSKRFITDESDIVVDFQFTRIGFKRNLYSAMLNYKKPNYSAGCFFVRDGEEITQSEGFELTKARKEFLTHIGDDSISNWMDSGIHVGVGKGDYSFSDSFYIYEGYRKGEWNVTFTYVNDEIGDYVYDDSLSAFVYVGSNNGNYVSKIRVPLPEKENYIGFDMGFDDKTRLKLTGLLFGSEYDRNTLSNINDDDNIGYFTKVKGYLNLIKTRWGDLNTFGGYSYRDRNFKPLSRIVQENFEERWNIESTSGMEKIKNGGIVYQKENLLLTKANISFLKRKDIDVVLKEGAFSLKRKNLPHIDITSSLVSVNSGTLSSDIKRIEGNISYSIWRILPSVYAKQEIRNESEKRRWREGGTKFGIQILEKSKLSIGYSKRFDDVSNTNEENYERESNIITRNFSFEIEKINVFRSNLNVTSRKREFTQQFPGENTEMVLIEFATRLVPFTRKLDIETNYSVIGKNSVLFTETFFEVEEGKGDYSKDPTTGKYYPDTLGNYERKVQSIGEGNPVTSLKTYLRISITPVELIRCNVTASITEENRGQEKLPIYTLRLSEFLDDSLTVNGKQSLDGSVSLYPRKLTSFSYSFNFIKGLNNEFVSGGEMDYSDRNEFRIEHRFSKKSEISFKYSRKKYFEEIIGLGVEKSEKKEEFTPEFSHYPLVNLRARIKAIRGTIEIEEPLWYSYLGVINIKTEEISPSLNYAIKHSAILNAILTVTKNSTSISEDELPYDVISSYPTGITTDWKLGTTVSISDLFSINVSYNGLNRPDKKTIHSANAELRADF